MSYGEPELLFYKYDMHSVMEAQRSQIDKNVQEYSGNALLNTPTDDIVHELAEKLRLEVPELQRVEAHADQHEGEVEVFDTYGAMFGEGHRGGRGGSLVQGTIVELHVPYTGDKNFFFVRPTTFDSAPPRAILQNGSLLIRHSGRNLTAEQVKKGFNSTLDDIERYLGWLRSSAEDFNGGLAAPIRSAVEARKAKLLSDQNLVANLGFSLKQRPDAPKTYVAPITRKPVITRPTAATTAPFKPEPALDNAAYRSILNIIQNMTLVMERSPTSFSKMGEEDIRQHYLVQLNGQFEGAATGETFNFEGKTDILIRDEGRNIFIAECKFWRGEKSFSETIDQILSYLSWRDTKAAIILFNRNKNMGDVLENVKVTAKAHPHYKKGPAIEAETRFQFVFGSPSDHNREIMLAVMVFDIPQS
jgi:hypothetical protein